MAPIRITALVVALALLAACAATFRNHGYMPPEDELANIIVGVDTRDSVEGSIGKPGVGGIAEASGWYYIRSTVRNYTWNAPEEIDREVLAISFASNGTVSNIERFGLEEGRVVRLSRRVTDSNTEGIGFLRQAFGNIGNLNAGDLLN
ncbi:MAG: outer membrane protein assembly factor BamE [Pseudomonadota bacterium]